MSNLNTKSVDFQPTISVLITSYNSEALIEESIDSALLLTKNIILVDQTSTDKTVELAKRKGVQIQLVPYTKLVEPLRKKELELATTDWVFILDADELITKELAEEVQKATTSDEYTHYRISRKEYFAKRVWLKHGGWWPNSQVRLIKKSAFVDWPSQIHSFPDIKGNEGYLKNAFVHYSKNDYEQIVNKTILFEDEESELLYKANKPVTTLTFFRKFLGELYRRMFKAKGYKDGTIGIIESIYQAFSKTITYLYLYEKKNSRAV